VVDFQDLVFEGAVNANHLFLLALCALACSCQSFDFAAQHKCNWTQFAQDPTHAGNACTKGQLPRKLLAHVVFDPFAGIAAAEAARGGEATLLVHYPAPLVVDDDVYLLAKGGSWTPCEPLGSFALADGGEQCGLAARDSQSWGVQRLHWEGGILKPVWTYASDWKPPPFALTDWEPVFQPAIGGDVLYVPGANGAVHRVDRLSGKLIGKLEAASATGAFVAGGIAVDSKGVAFFTVLTTAPEGGLLVRADSAGTQTTVSFDALVPGAPTDCRGTFNPPSFERPYPPVDGGIFLEPPKITCRAQRPGLNSTPAVAPDGTVYVVGRAHNSSRYSSLIAATNALKPQWARSLRGILNDGCGVTNPSIGVPNPDGGTTRTGLCRVGAPQGVDPATNEPPAGRVDDASTSSPVVLPDGTVLYGALTSYNTARGHLLRFSSTGEPMETYDFGWDVTPAVWKHDGSFSLLSKDNHYFEWDGSAPKFLLTRLSPSLKPEWSFKNSNLEACHTEVDGGVTCATGDHPDGFEWCINAPAVDSEGTMFANAEDGNLYVIDATGKEKGRFFLKLAIGAAYTPIAIDKVGRIYAENGGELFVVGE
jgi:hypothetical protein